MTHSDAQLIIDLRAIRRNWRKLQGSVADNTVCAAVTKANAYGLGAEQVMPALYAEGCRQFFVASIQEGIEARAWVPADAYIYILNGLRPGAETACVAHNLIPVLFTWEQFNRWHQLNLQRSEPLPCALKFDSGMTRLGVSMGDLQELCSQAPLLHKLHPVMLISHLASADEPENPQNQRQLASFKTALSVMREQVPGLQGSLANSSGIFLGAEFHADIARPGAAIYGVNPTPHLPSPVEPVVTLRLPIIQIRHVKGGELVGYGGTYKVPEKGRLAVTIGGYADGILRAAGNHAAGYVAGIRVPLIGRVSMDSTVFDVSYVPDSILPDQACEVMSIELLGHNSGVDELAQAANTIGYEILTSLGDRYSRFYLND